jgi:hypothetical protein
MLPDFVLCKKYIFPTYAQGDVIDFEIGSLGNLECPLLGKKIYRSSRKLL